MKKPKDAITGIAGSAILAGLVSLLGAGFVAPTASAAEPIKIGDINSYKRLPAHTVPYKMGSGGRSSSYRATTQASPARR